MIKQAICLITCGDLERIKCFVKQFKRHPEINIYIHYDIAHVADELKPEFEEALYQLDGVKLVSSIYRTYRYSMNLVAAELYLYLEALKDPENSTFHLFSETDYLLTSPCYFCDYFKKYKDFDFITYIHDDSRLASSEYRNVLNDYINQKYGLRSEFLVKACQQKSLCRLTVEKLIYGYLESFNELMNIQEVFDNLIGAVDECLIPNIIFHCIGDNSMPCKRYINWHGSNGDHPNVLKYSDYINAEQRKHKCYVDIAILQQLIVRKIDCFNEDSMKFLEVFRAKFYDIEAKQREIHQI